MGTSEMSTGLGKIHTILLMVSMDAASYGVGWCENNYLGSETLKCFTQLDIEHLSY